MSDVLRDPTKVAAHPTERSKTCVSNGMFNKRTNVKCTSELDTDPVTQTVLITTRHLPEISKAPGG